MSDQGVLNALAGHAFLQGLSQAQLEAIAPCAQLMRMGAGQFLGREKEPGNAFYLIRAGRVAIEIYAPQRGSVRVQTIGPGEMVGWSWLVPPHRWQFDARVIEPIEGVALDAMCLRVKCEENHELGYQLLKRLVAVIGKRLEATRLQVLDIYR
jgi:CRP-like cAMP-binding protein